MGKKVTFVVIVGIISIMIIITAVSLLFMTTFTQTFSNTDPLRANTSQSAEITEVNKIRTDNTSSAENTSTANNTSTDDNKGTTDKALIESYISEVQNLIKETHYKNAQQQINKALKVAPENSALMALQSQLNTLEKDLVLYKGPIYHVFFHSLIVYPELCFTGDSMEQGYNNWMTTVKEFKLMIQEMYDRGYTLVDLRELFKQDASGKMTAQDLYLPKGQKPLVISVDDMSYYTYMKKDGFAKKLVLDDKGNPASLIDTPEGKEIISPEGDVVPILDNFVNENPDFSFKGAKGTLALTGYEGILGYRTNHNNPSWQKEKNDVIPVVAKLKETGWAFASHSYTHRRTFSEGTITLNYLKYDTEKWKEEVGSIVGPTNLYISPFGATFKQKDARMRYIISQGFNIYCGVGPSPSYILYKDNVYMERMDLDGYKMHHMPKIMKELFDVSKVMDPSRPPFK